MKRKSTRRLATVFLSLFLVCICLATVFAFPVSAAAASNSDYVYKTDYTTKDKKPTYTATLNENNRLLKELNKKENKVLQKVRSEGKDWVNDGFAILEAMQNSSSEDFDWEKAGVELGKNILTSIAGIWGFDGIAGALLDGIESLTSSGQAPLSQVQVLSDDIDKRFNAISDQLYDIEEELGALSNQVTSTANDVLSGTQTQINNLEAKQILRSFMSSGEGNFSYLEYSNYLYGSNSTYVNASEAYYILLLEAIASDAGDEQIEYYYNKLFDSLYSNIHIYNQYYYGDITGLDKSMVAYYYDYLSYNPNLVDDGTSAEYQALLFALDLYTTYVYSYEILEMCFAYQAADMYLEASLAGRDISDSDTYQYADGKLIKYSTIKNALVDMQANLVAAEEQIVEDIAYILGMKDSYIVVDANGDIHSIGNYGESFGNIADDQIVYLNVIPDEICDLFVLNPDNFSYFVNGKNYIGTDKGVFNSDNVDVDTFVASVKYGSTELYNVEFTKIDSINKNPQNTPIYEFSGGSGTLDDPYLISNSIQFDMIEEDLDASYQLISNIDINGTYSPIGTEKKPFNGTFDGNGYAINNLIVDSLEYDSTKITMTPTTGMFGTIGRTGVVKNLTLNGLRVVSDHQSDSIYPENDVSYFCIGGIAGTNKGVIGNCSVSSHSSIIVNRLKQTQDSRTVEIYVGGIAGNNSGIIEYCSTDDLSISADSHLYYYNESTSKNQHSLYVGGIVAVTNNTVRNCRVSENTKISAYAKSIADSEDREKPMLTVFAGGIVGDTSATQFLSNVYSACDITRCKGEIYNEGTYWGSHRYSWDNVSVKKGLYYPTFLPLSASETVDEYEMNFYSSEYLSIYNKNYTAKSNEVYLTEDRGLTVQEIQEVALASSKELKVKIVSDETKANTDALAALGNKIISTYDNAIFALDTQKTNVSIELTNNVCDINAKYLTEYFDKLIDEENKVKNIAFKDANGNSVEASIVGYYGFYTYHESPDAQLVTVKVFFYVDDELLSDDVTLSIKGKELIKWEITDFVDATFEKGTSVSDCEKTIFDHGFRIVYTYSNGQTEEYIINDANDATIANLNTSESGSKTIIIYHNEQPAGKLLKFEQTIEIICHHNFVKVDEETVEANCKLLGYEVWRCNKDGCAETIHKNYVKGDHTYVVKSGQAATCHEAGYTQEVLCSVCGEVFESTEWIQALPHNHVSSSESGYKANGSYPAAKYHYCTNGDHYEPHQYTVSEYVDENGTLVYLYSCFCGYKNPVPDYNIKTKENGEKPVVVVTNGHVLNVGDEVVVYVQIINNPGFKGATFGIRYDNGLELVSADESMIVPQQLKVRNEVYNGYNFLWAKGDGNKTTEDGYLLKLTFKYVDEAEGEQHISVVYGMSNGSEGGFCTLDDGYHMFMTQSGTISVVEHLPGDVNNDEVVDIMDATYIAWSIVGKEDENGNKIQVNAKYADVNLDGKVDLLDVLAILQSISGRYGTSLLSSNYKLFFDLNGFICNDVDESVMVEFYDENGNRTKWSENVDFVKYEALMKQLGYTFAGWYTRMDCTCTGTCIHVVKATEFITYDKYQGNQTLYARWEKNKIIFDMNGATSEQIEDIVCSSNTTIVKLPTPSLSFDVDYYVTGYEGVYKKLPIYKNFEGWYIEGTDIRVTEYDLSQPNVGTLKLVARWSDYIWNTPTEERIGYNDVTTWYYRNQYADDFIISSIDDDTLQLIINNGLTLYGKENLINYNITYTGIEGVVNFVPQKDSYTVKDVFTFEDGSILMRKGYEFDGWYADGYSQKITSTNQLVSLGIGNVTLTAKWNAKTYIIEVNVIDVNQSSKTDSKGNPKYGTNATSIGLVYNKVTLYYTFGDETKGIEQGYYTNAALTTKATINTFGEYADFIFGGLFESEINDNGHSYASYDANTCVFSSEGEFLSAPSLLNEQILNGNNATLYALLNPQVYTITFDNNFYNLLENTNRSGTYFDNCRLTVTYDATTKTYTLTNSGTDDPYCGIGQFVYLEAGVEYKVHMTVSGSKTNAVQMFYAIGGAYSESNSIKFNGGDNIRSIKVDTSGTYLIRLDNDTGSTTTISEFYIYTEHTHLINVNYNEELPDISLPTNVYYKADSYKYGGDVYYNAQGKAQSIYNISGSKTFEATWNTKRLAGYTYISNSNSSNEKLLTAISQDVYAKYALIEDINLNNSAWSSISSFAGELDGRGHTISNATVTIGGYKTVGSTTGGFFKELTNSAVIKNVRFTNIIVSFQNDDYTSGISNKENILYCGILCGKNSGTIEKVELDGCSITSYFYKYEAGGSGIADKVTHAGGLAGINYGTIRHSKVNNSTVTAGSKSGTTGRGKWNYIGGICGTNQGNIATCSSTNNTLTGITYEGKTGHYISDFAGNNSGNIASDCTKQNNTINS